jgi:hypothetical protein
MSRVLGMNAKLYRAAALLTGTDDTDASGASWDEIANVRDVTLNLETGEADVTTRANSGWKQTLPTLKDGSVEFEMVWDTNDPDFAAIRDAWLNNDEIALAVMDGPIASAGQGLVSNFAITNFSRTEPLEDAIKVSVTAKPSSFSQWYIIGES